MALGTTVTPGRQPIADFCSPYTASGQSLLVDGAPLQRLHELAPVTHWFVRDRPRRKVVQTAITREVLGVCVRKGDTSLRDAIDTAQAALARDCTLAALIGKWLGDGATTP